MITLELTEYCIYDEEQKAKAIKYLVRLGDGQALEECVAATRKDYKALWEACDVPAHPIKQGD